MKQVKKLLVILPLVALFVLGSLPVLAVEPNKDSITTEIARLEDLLKKAKDNSTKKQEDVEPSDYWILSKDVTKAEEGIAQAKRGVENAQTEAEFKEIINGLNEVAALIKKGTKAAAPSPVTPPAQTETYQLIVEYYLDENCKEPAEEKTRTYTLDEKFFKDFMNGSAMVNSYANVKALAKSIENLVMAQLQNGFKEGQDSFALAAETFLQGKEKVATVKLYLPQVNSKKVIAYDIHNNEFVMDRLYRLELNEYWDSPSDVAKAFYENSVSVKRDYLYAGFATQDKRPCIVYAATYLEKIAGKVYASALETYKADIIVFVVPRVIDIKTIHVFPEGTRDDLIEYVPVPYEVWASLQHSFKFMDLPGIFRTRIQKVNEMGFAFREVKFYNGINEITGLLSGYDWFDNWVTGDHNDRCVARVFYDKAVAAAKEVPTEKKVDAATAPQAQIQAPAAQAPVTAANTTTTTAPANTLPVTGASDSIFLFLSSAALMAVGILFFKKH